jgi:hypothetical protein
VARLPLVLAADVGKMGAECDVLFMYALLISLILAIYDSSLFAVGVS